MRRTSGGSHRYSNHLYPRTGQASRLASAASKQVGDGQRRLDYSVFRIRHRDDGVPHPGSLRHPPVWLGAGKHARELRLRVGEHIRLVQRRPVAGEHPDDVRGPPADLWQVLSSRHLSIWASTTERTVGLADQLAQEVYDQRTLFESGTRRAATRSPTRRPSASEPARILDPRQELSNVEAEFRLLSGYSRQLNPAAKARATSPGSFPTAPPGPIPRRLGGERHDRRCSECVGDCGEQRLSFGRDAARRR